MKVKIKVDVPKGAPGVTYFGHTYKWHSTYYDMGMEYTISPEDFNPDIMVSLEPAKKTPELTPLPEISISEAATGEEESAPDLTGDLKEKEEKPSPSSKTSKKSSRK